LPKRGVFALPEEILITVGAQHAYYLLAEALFDENQRVGLEEPGHPHARNSFAPRHPQCLPLAVDEQGLKVDRLPALDYVFVTPSHQSPTTGTLSMERRRLLLQKAQDKDFVVIEDDYEAENLYAGEPMPALKSLDKVGRVIYVGSVSKSLSPSLRLGYIGAPRALIAELRGLRHAMVRHPSAFLQHTFALFLSLGHHDVHARRVNQAMQERMSMVARALQQYLPDFQFTLPSGGASVWVRAPDWADSSELALIARKHGVLIEAGDVFFMHPPYPCPYFRLRLLDLLRRSGIGCRPQVICRPLATRVVAIAVHEPPAGPFFRLETPRRQERGFLLLKPRFEVGSAQPSESCDRCKLVSANVVALNQCTPLFDFALQEGCELLGGIADRLNAH
jgi:GntR family transcriptional regulator/MocR family aminotransferase